jgi:hypothetical protein
MTPWRLRALFTEPQIDELAALVDARVVVLLEQKLPKELAKLIAKEHADGWARFVEAVIPRRQEASPNIIRFPPTEHVGCRVHADEAAEFAQATLDAEAFFAACRAGWDRRTLRTLSKKLSPTAVEILLQLRDEWNARRAQTSGM